MDIVYQHAYRACRACQGKFKTQRDIQLAMLSSTEPIRAVCGKYVTPEMKSSRPCPSCQLRFGMKYKDDACSLCSSTDGLD